MLMAIVAGFIMSCVLVIPSEVKADSNEVHLVDGAAAVEFTEGNGSSKYIEVDDMTKLVFVSVALDNTSLSWEQDLNSSTPSFNMWEYLGTNVDKITAKRVGSTMYLSCYYNDTLTYGSTSTSEPCGSSCSSSSVTPEYQAKASAQATAFGNYIADTSAVLSAANNGASVSPVAVVNYIVAMQQAAIAQQTDSIQATIMQQQGAVNQQQLAIQASIAKTLKDIEEMMAALMGSSIVAK